MKPYFVNGTEVLPPDLLAQVQRYWSGLVWIPMPNTFFSERRELVVTLKEQGVSGVEIAGLAEISRRRVNQILAMEND